MIHFEKLVNVNYLDSSPFAPSDCLAIEEFLFQRCETGESTDLLWVWEPQTLFVVIGYGNKAASEVNLAQCEIDSVPVLRRLSGGGTRTSD